MYLLVNKLVLNNEDILVVLNKSNFELASRFQNIPLGTVIQFSSKLLLRIDSSRI